MILPNYLIIGASKCATSSLHTLLARHPDVYMAAGEPEFFCRDAIYSRGIDWYAEHCFANAPSVRAIGEGSNRYTMRESHPLAAARIARHLPDAKLVYITRDPIERTYSYWLQKRSQGDPVHPRFDVAIRRNRRELVDSSRYWHQLQPYLTRFEQDQIKVMFFEDFKANPVAFLQHCFSFLGVTSNPDSIDVSIHANPTAGKHVDSPLLYHLRKLPLYRLRQLVPEPWRASVKKRHLRTRTPRSTSISHDARKWLFTQFEDDARALLAYCNKPLCLWNMFTARA